MIPLPKVMGKCEDPNGVFCKKLRQDIKVLAGFPLALQLWAFEAIPALLKRLGGTNEQTLLAYDGEKLPQHTGLVVSAVLDVEHDPKASIGEWRGGDSAELKYDHQEAVKGKKRKATHGSSKEQEGHALKQRRLSRFFSRKVKWGGGKTEELEAKVEKLIDVETQAY
ncbi:hypothetical protein HID58_066919 [Brassica napus]|uniref:Uncharacterized protein n=1 Tax=Brassica napus TaxID=3708 RepID=A0ABQ7ZH12_BRANA|nr:hypothetical protein HID58_066919 [Brassica napus]